MRLTSDMGLMLECHKGRNKSQPITHGIINEFNVCCLLLNAANVT